MSSTVSPLESKRFSIVLKLRICSLKLVGSNIIILLAKLSNWLLDICFTLSIDNPPSVSINMALSPFLAH